MSLFYCFNIFSKLAVGGLSGFEYVGILAGEAHAPARNVGRSVMIAAPIIALMFVLGTSSVLAFIGNNQIDLIGPVPQTLRLGLQSFGAAGTIASVGILLMTVRSISSMSIHFTGSSCLPMVAGRDDLLPVWFSRLCIRVAQNTNQLNHVRRRDNAGDRHPEPDRRGIAVSISSRGQRHQSFYGIVYTAHVLRHLSNCGRRRDPIRSALMAAIRRRLRPHSFVCWPSSSPSIQSLMRLTGYFSRQK